MSKILIFGAGAVGQYIGGLLTRAGVHKVTLIGRPEHYDAIRRGGLNIQLPRTNEYLSKLNFLTATRNIPTNDTFDWIFMTVKGYDLKNSVIELKNIIKRSKDVRFLLFQRGVTTHKQLYRIIPDDRLFSASLTNNVAILTPGTVTQLNVAGALCLAPMDKKEKPEDLLKLFDGTGIKTKKFKDWKSMKWSATLFEMLTDSICAMGDYTPDKELKFSALLNLEMEAFNEAWDVTRKNRTKIVNLPGYNPGKVRFLNSWIPGFLNHSMIAGYLTKEKHTRMLTIKNDMEKGKKSNEILFINGGFAEEGKAMGVDTPANGFVTQELMKIISGRTKWERYRKKPAEIVAHFHQYKHKYLESEN